MPTFLSRTNLNDRIERLFLVFAIVVTGAIESKR